MYVIGEDSRGPISIIDTTTSKGVSLAPGGHAQGPRAVVVNPATNRIYAPNASGSVTVIDGATNVAKTGNATWSGTLYRAIGPAFSATPWDPSRVALAAAGQVTFVFSDAGNGTMTSTVDGITQSMAIARQVFSSPATACR